MRMKVIAVFALLLFAGMLFCIYMNRFSNASPKVFAPGEEDVIWSEPVNGIKARLLLKEGGTDFGVKFLIPYLELKNVSDISRNLKISCDSTHLKVELVDYAGKSVTEHSSTERSGPYVPLPEVILPYGSSICLDLECNTWGIDPSAAAAVCTYSGCWMFKESENGKFRLRATLQDEATASLPDKNIWHGKIKTPPRPVSW